MIDLNTTTRQFLLPEELAEILLVTTRTVYRWIDENRLAAVHIGGTKRIPVAEVRRVCRIRPPQEPFPRTATSKSASVA